MAENKQTTQAVEPGLEKALRELDYSNPAHTNTKGQPDLNFLKETLSRKVTRPEVDAALIAINATSEPQAGAQKKAEPAPAADVPEKQVKRVKVRNVTFVSVG